MANLILFNRNTKFPDRELEHKLAAAKPGASPSRPPFTTTIQTDWPQQRGAM